MNQPMPFAYAPRVNESVLIDLTEQLVSVDLCQRWLQQAHDSTADDAFRRLIADVMQDLDSLGSTDGELAGLVLGALGSVQSALEVTELGEA